MANHGGGDGYPWDDSGSIRPDLSHNVSSISAVSSMSSGDEPRVSVVSLPSPMLDGQGSFSSEQSDVSHVQLSSIEGSGVRSPSSLHRSSASLPDALRVGSPSTPLGGLFNPFRSAKGSYEAVSAADRSKRGSTSSRPGSRRFSTQRKGSLLGGNHKSIPEGEEIDMGLLQSAMPMSFTPHKTGYATVEEEESDIVGDRGSVDLSSFTGPMNPLSETRWKEINRQEQSGILTGGLGAGWTPDDTDTITSTDLYASAPQTPRTPSLSRRMSFRSPGLSRQPTLRDLAQIEANKRGKVIQVIVEDEQKETEEEEEAIGDIVDLSSMTGSANTRSIHDPLNMPKQLRKNTLLVPNSEVFFPQANWKPFSMRWPYLTALIVISVTLAASQEYLYQKSSKKPLYEFKSASELNTWDYFCFKYLPTIVAVIFGILWQVTDFEVKRLEAYYQLSKPGGALAAESINSGQ
ncbi:hypothetical protein LSUB1_G006218 [Lachnellula subtilissima]|uniref:Uncharacterized protein n=1 Tax=Lachnellula subtilissima TaxID=602034 RepID=A0A8H8U8U6_9HELO|nr:hypothetical protein LSUB1_G006218 [Lachnellula subtilissima]